MPPGVAKAIRAPFSTFPKRDRRGSVAILMKKEAPLE